MAQPFVGEIRMFAGNFAPAGWMFCEGQLLPISENETLFIVIGTTYGGDGQSTFALPDLRGRLPVHFGSGFIVGDTGGVEQVTLSTNQMPAHSHPLLASSNAATSQTPANLVLGQAQAVSYFNLPDNIASLSPLSVGATGGSQPHTNFQPYLCVNYIISLFGLFPNP
jgi:microcystin-dependent protein